MTATRTPRPRGTLTAKLRALRQPVVTLCAVLLLANLLIPAATVTPAAAGEGFICHGIAPAPAEGGDTTHRHPFQTCCFSAAVALMPGALAAPPEATPAAFAAPAAVAATIRSARPAGSARIRAPPLS